MNIRCTSCGLEAYPSLVLNDRMAMAPSCPSCGREHAAIDANDMAETPIAPVEKVAKVVPIRAPGPSTVRFDDTGVTITTSHSDDLFTQIRARIQYLDLELAKNAGYAVERKQLARMLAAAEKTK